MFYQAIDLAVEIAKQVGMDELTDRLACLQIEVGEHNNQVIERLEKIAEEVENSKDLSDLLERLTGKDD